FAFKLAAASAALLRDATKNVGAIITGRRNFDGTGAWGGRPPLGVPHVVMTHNPVRDWMKPGSPFTFVTTGIEAAIAKARELAAGKDVAISTASVMRQALAAGLLDEINLDLVPVILGRGIPLFGPDMALHRLEQTRVVVGTGVTHLQYKVLRS